jgi:acetylglutamate kinase
MIVIKYGGHVLESAEANSAIIETIAQFHLGGGRVVLVHGGGPAIDAELKFHGVESTMKSGYRTTSPEAMEIVQRTLSGGVLRELTNKFIAHGVNAVGLSSGDGRTLRARKFKPSVNGDEIDIGLVGEAESADPSFLNLLLDNGYLPIVSPVSVQSDGQALNINGDIATGSIAGALKATEVLFITDVPGIYRNWPDIASLISEISLSELIELSPSFTDGMAPKVRAVINALSSGAARARVIDGREILNLSAALKGQGGTVVYA